jgi:arylsulfatase
MPSRPNVLLITADQMRCDALACNGNSFVATPNLDALAARGVTFTNAFSPNPICIPGRAALTTGNYPHVCTGTKNNGGRIRDDQVKIASHFGSSGYRTYAIGKLHYHPYSPPDQPRLVHGFDLWEACESGRMIAQFDPTGQQRGIEDYFDYLRDVGWGGYSRAHAAGNNDVHPAPSPLPAAHHEEAWVATRSIANLQQHFASRPKQPFFLWASFAKPHSPYDPPEPYNRRYDPRLLPLPVGSRELLADRDPYLRTMPITYGWDRMSPEAIQVARAHYYGLVTFQDEMIGRILSYLDEMGRLDDTIVVYTADHGDLLGDFGCFFKSNMLQGSVGVPMVWAGPGIRPHEGPCEELVGLQDVLPTLAELSECPLPQWVHGVSLAATLGKRSAPTRDFYVSQCLDSPRQRYMIRTRQYKYVYHELGGIEELYDVLEDPAELHNLAREKRVIVEELRGLLIDWCREFGDEAIFDGGDLKVSPEDTGAATEFSARHMGWRWY